MTVIGVNWTLRTTVLAIVSLAAGSSDGANTIRDGRQDVEAKLEYCKTCHGRSGEGYYGYFAMPRLAGQQPRYIETQLRAFIERRRTNPVMFNVAHSLSPSMLAALADHFHTLNPPPAGSGPQRLAASGKTIYEEGIPEANVAACFACHGLEGRGQDEIPRLAGQLYPYVVKALTSWDKERGQGAGKSDTSAIMVPTAHNLTQSQIAAVAAYVSHLK
jgi:cytochrome c553